MSDHRPIPHEFPHPRRVPWWITLAFAGLTLVLGYSLCVRSITLSDEGYLLQQAWEMLGGKILYRDLDSFVAPGVWFLHVALFAVAGPSIWVTRMAILVCLLLTVWLAYRVVTRLAGDVYGIATIVLFWIFVLWAFPAWTFSFYSPYAVMFALAALDRLLVWSERPSTRGLLAVGVMLGLSGLFKQNYGAFATVGAAVGLVALSLERRLAAGVVARALVRVLAGIVLVGVPVAAYFAYHGALGDAFAALVIHPLTGFVGEHTIAYASLREVWDVSKITGVRRLMYTSVLNVNSGLHLVTTESISEWVTALHIIAYWLPPLLFLAAGWLSLASVRAGRGLDAPLIAVLAMTAAVFLGVFPRADFNHLMHVYQPVLILGCIVVHRASRVLRPWAGRMAVVIGVMLVLPYGLTAAYWYGELLRNQDTPLLTARAGIKIDSIRAGMISDEVQAIRELTGEGEPVLTLNGLSMLNFLADRPAPSRYHNLYAVHIAHDQGAGVVEAAERAKVRLIVAEKNNFFADRARLHGYAPKLIRYIRRYFEPAFAIAVDEHLFLTRRATPLPDRDTISAISHCDVRLHWFAPRVIRSHLLFYSLYHRFRSPKDGVLRGPDGDAVEQRQQELVTVCRVTVPDDAVLAVGFGYRQPLKVAPGTVLRGEIWAVSPDTEDPRLDRLLAADISVTAIDGWRSPAPREYRIDLSTLARRSILLVFKTILRGDVALHPFEVEGFAATWTNPLMEYDRPRPDEREGDVSADRRGH